MSYRCAIFDPLAAAMGVEPGGPWVKCDTCGVKLTAITSRHGMPKKWLLDGKAPPGWRTEKHADGTRTDWCQRCK